MPLAPFQRSQNKTRLAKGQSQLGWQIGYSFEHYVHLPPNASFSLEEGRKGSFPPASPGQGLVMQRPTAQR
jgi:hypothetical protein